MQGKDASEQVAKGKPNVGIDVCETWLDIHSANLERRAA
jgi:hypothetical protein